MARKVFVSSDMSIDEGVYAVAKRSAKSALIWPWFLTALDDWGRTDASPHKLKSRLFPDWPGVSRSDIEKAVLIYAECGLVSLYEGGGETYAAVDENNWREYQTHIRWDRKGGAESKHPAPGDVSTTIREVPGSSGSIPPSPSPSPSPSKHDALVALAMEEVKTSRSTSEDYAKVIDKARTRLSDQTIERTILELANWEPKKPRPKMHLTLAAWLLKCPADVHPTSHYHFKDDSEPPGVPPPEDTKAAMAKLLRKK